NRFFAGGSIRQHPRKRRDFSEPAPIVFLLHVNREGHGDAFLDTLLFTSSYCRHYIVGTATTAYRHYTLQRVEGLTAICLVLGFPVLGVGFLVLGVPSRPQGRTLPVSGGPQALSRAMAKKPALWAVRSTGLLGQVGRMK